MYSCVKGLALIWVGMILAATPAQSESEFSANIAFILGQRSMSHSYWSGQGAENMTSVGIDAYMGTRRGGLLLGINTSAPSSGSGTDVVEIDFAGRRYLPIGPVFRPYFSLGVAIFSSDVNSQKDETAGYFANLGVSFFTRPVNVGADLRFVAGADGRPGGHNATMNYVQFAVFFGFGR